MANNETRRSTGRGADGHFPGLNLGGDFLSPAEADAIYQAEANLAADVSDTLDSPVWTEAAGVPMDEGRPALVPSVNRGWYRTYDAAISPVEHGTVDIGCIVGDLDRDQLEWELSNESPVTGQVVFRLVGGRVVAHLVSYTAFA